MSLKGEQTDLWEPGAGRLVTINRRWRVIRWKDWFYRAGHLPHQDHECRVIEAEDYEDTRELLIADVDGKNAKTITPQSQ